MVSSWDGCWECSCFAIVDASAAASSVLFAGSLQPVNCVAAVWVGFNFQVCGGVSELVCLLSVSKFSLRQSASIVTKSLSSPAGACCQSKTNTSCSRQYKIKPKYYPKLPLLNIAQMSLRTHILVKCFHCFGHSPGWHSLGSQHCYSITGVCCTGIHKPRQSCNQNSSIAIRQRIGCYFKNVQDLHLLPCRLNVGEFLFISLWNKWQAC